MIKEEKSNNPDQQVNDMNLGKGVGINLDDDDNANTDFFGALMPNTD